ncbi:MAG: hypothetical protein V1777_01655 [Candidatus Micrarchaeota archaeon]
MAHERPQQKVSGQQAMNAFGSIQADIRALNSSVLLLSQKMQYLVRNEKILGRNLIVLSKRLKERETEGLEKSGGQLPPQFLQEFSEVKTKVESHERTLLELQNDVAEIKDRYAKADSVSELKYVIDAINPLEFVTVKQVQELLEKEKSAVQKKK